MSNAPAPVQPPAPNAAPAPGKSKLLYIGLGAIVVLGSLGGGAYWWTLRAAPAETAESAPAKAAAAEHGPRGIVSFDPFVVNLADTSASRFLRVSVQLVVDSVDEAKEMQETPVAMMQARSAILDLLTTQTSDVVVTPDGKAALRKAIAAQVGHDGHVGVVDVLFSDFVVQF